MGHVADTARRRVGTRIDAPPACDSPTAGVVVGIGRFRHVNNQLDFRRLILLDSDGETEDALRASLDPSAIDSRLNHPPPRTLERLYMSELMCHVPHDLPLFSEIRDCQVFDQFCAHIDLLWEFPSRVQGRFVRGQFQLLRNEGFDRDHAPRPELTFHGGQTHSSFAVG
jgi:hypothetical protein